MQLYDRPMSAIPVSIGTSLALESLFTGTQKPYDPERKPPQKVELHEYSEIWINLETLIRNIAQSVSRETYFACVPSHILEILLTEIEIIESIFATEGHGLCRPVFYLCSYKSLAAECKGKGVLLRESTTPIQKSYDFKSDKVLKELVRQTDKIHQLDSELRPDHYGNALIITHNPHDLTSRSRFKKLALLESHTGLLKTYAQWNTKYAPLGKESLDHLPFHKSLLLIFGDRSQIQPAAYKVRQMVLDISVKNKWTPVSSMEKVHESFREHVLHPADLAVLLRY